MKNTITLTKPYVVDYGVREIADTAFMLSPGFRMPYHNSTAGWTARGAISPAPGHPGLRMRGVGIYGWSDRWDPAWHPTNWTDTASRPLSELNGIEANHVDCLELEDVIIEKVPAHAVYCPASENVSISRLQARRCYSGVYVDYYSEVSEFKPAFWPRRLARNVSLFDCVIADTWQTSVRGVSPGWEDVYDPAGCIGAAGYYIYATDGITLTNCKSTGAGKGSIKIALSRNVLLERFMGSGVQVVGSLYWSAEKGANQLATVAEGTPDAPLLTENVELRECVLSPALMLRSDSRVGHTFQFAWPIKGAVKVVGGHVWWPGRPGFAYLQAWESCGADVRGVTFHGPKPDAMPTYGATNGLFQIGDYGQTHSTRASLNDDLLTVNTFRAG